MATEDDDTPRRDDDPARDAPGDDASEDEGSGEASGAGAGNGEDGPGVEPRFGFSESEHLAEIDHLRAEVEKERAKTAEMRDALVRTAADFDNFRKRVERDRVEDRKQAGANIVKSLLPVLDAVGRAICSAGSAENNPELRGFVEGIRMVETQLLDTLKQAGLEPVPTAGTFDPLHHEALMQAEDATVPHMTILDVFEPGYKLGGRLLRPARVKVANNPGGTADGGRGGDDDAAAEDNLGEA